MSGSLVRRGVAVGAALTLVAAVVWFGCSQDRAAPTAPGDLQPSVSLLGFQERLAAAVAVQDRHTERLMAIPGVVGTGTALTPGGRPAVKVFTTTAGMPGIPESLDGVPVTVEVTGMILARSDPTTRFSRPVPIGVSTGHPDITAGTIGARVKDGAGNVYALSNNHVYAKSNDALLGDNVLQPGTFDGGVDPADRIGDLAAFQPIDFSGGDNTIDAAIALSSTGLLGNATPSDDGYGTPSSAIFGDSDGDGLLDNTTDLLNLSVQKYGRTTSLTQGTITEVNVTVDVCYELFLGIFCMKLARFVNQIGISPGSFSSGGDSGSLIVSADANKNPVALLFAGSSTRTFANRIDLVLARFNVTIDDTPPGPLTDVAVTGVSAPASVAEGDVVSVDVTVRNLGNQDVGSFDVTLRDDGVEIGSQAVSSLAAGASAILAYSWNTGGASIGTHSLEGSHNLADDDASNNSMSTTVTVNEPAAGVTVTGISPNTMQRGTTILATISGSGFVTGAVVTYENGKGPAPTALVLDVGSNSIMAMVTAKSGGPRRNRVWDVRVTNLDGSSGVLVGGFTITP